MSDIRRVILIVLDSAGVGEMPDAEEYGDGGSDTVGNIAKHVGGLHLPNLEALGLGRVANLAHPCNGAVEGCYGRMAEKSAGKDTTTGHWEMAGIVTAEPFPTYPAGFPAEVIGPFEKKIGRKVLWNRPASGTEIIARLGDEHRRTGRPIVYTSADSVFQIACHEEVVPLETLYAWCRAAREILQGKHRVGRVIARPFRGSSGKYQRTGNRRDFAVDPPTPNLLTLLKESGRPVVAIGKIEDIFNGVGITESIHTKGNPDTTGETIKAIREGRGRNGLVFVNLVDFDMLYGHRNDTEGYAKALREFDAALPAIREAMSEDDLLVVTADHGNDPTTPSTDHSREYVPVLVWGRSLRTGVDLGTRGSFCDLGQTLAEIFGLPRLAHGISFWREIGGGGEP